MELPSEMIEHIGKFMDLPPEIIEHIGNFMDLPPEIIEQIGKFLSIHDIGNMRKLSKFFNNSLGPIYNKRTKNIYWKITVHILGNSKLSHFEIHKASVSLGYFPRNLITDMYDHEICYDCEDNSHETIKNYQIFTVINKGIGGKVFENIVNNVFKHDDKNEIILSVIPNINLGFEVSFDVSVGDISSKNVMSVGAELYLGDLDISNYDKCNVKLVIQGKMVNDLEGNNNNNDNNDSYDLGDYDLNRYSNGIYDGDSY